MKREMFQLRKFLDSIDELGSLVVFFVIHVEILVTISVAAFINVFSQLQDQTAQVFGRDVGDLVKKSDRRVASH